MASRGRVGGWVFRPRRHNNRRTNSKKRVETSRTKSLDNPFKNSNTYDSDNRVQLSFIVLVPFLFPLVGRPRLFFSALITSPTHLKPLLLARNTCGRESVCTINSKKKLYLQEIQLLLFQVFHARRLGHWQRLEVQPPHIPTFTTSSPKGRIRIAHGRLSFLPGKDRRRN